MLKTGFNGDFSMDYPNLIARLTNPGVDQKCERQLLAFQSPNCFTARPALQVVPWATRRNNLLWTWSLQTV